MFIIPGKTATFSISILQSIDTTVRETQVLCLSPTRELAVQIQKVSFSRLVTIMIVSRSSWLSVIT